MYKNKYEPETRIRRNGRKESVEFIKSLIEPKTLTEEDISKLKSFLDSF